MIETPDDSVLASPDVRRIVFSSALDAAMPAGAHAQLLLSGDSRYDCLLLAQHIEPGAAGPPRHKHDVDQYYFVTSGTMTIDLGGDVRDVDAGTLVVVPAGMGHTTFNRSTKSEYHIELFVPDQPLKMLSTPAQQYDGKALRPELVSLRAGRHFANQVIDFRVLALGPDARHAIDASRDDLLIVVLNGAVEIDYDDALIDIERNDLVAVPRGALLSARATGAEPPASLLLIRLKNTDDRRAADDADAARRI
jgi:mannose-6-phosphate isomerase-like protein (cupin superfamily)